jgi:hypothetical protein
MNDLRKAAEMALRSLWKNAIEAWLRDARRRWHLMKE